MWLQRHPLAERWKRSAVQGRETAERGYGTQAAAVFAGEWRCVCPHADDTDTRLNAVSGDAARLAALHVRGLDGPEPLTAVKAASPAAPTRPGAEPGLGSGRGRTIGTYTGQCHMVVGL